MKTLPYRFSVCGKHEIELYAHSGLTHLLSLEDPETPKDTPEWFRGEHLQLCFHDVENRVEARLLMASLPTEAQVAEILQLGERCLNAARSAPVHLLVHCFAGISRSTAASFALVAQAVGAGHAECAMDHVRQIRREAYPNRLMVKFADHLLRRNGELIGVLEQMRQDYWRSLKEFARASRGRT